MPNLSPAQIVQELDLPSRVELFIFTYFEGGGTKTYLTNTVRSSEIWWDGNKYIPFPLSITGLGFSEENASEKPKVIVSNIGLAQLGIPNLKGSSLDVIITYDTYIGTSAGSATSLAIAKHHYKFARMVSRTAKQLVYEMDTLLSYNGRKFPPRQILREGDLNFRFEGAGLFKQVN